MYRADIGVLLIIGLFFICFFPQEIFGGRFTILGDSLYYSYPMRRVAWEMVRHGNLPLWTPYIFSGYPLLSMAQLGLGYPLTWMYLLLPGYVAEQIYVLAPYVLAPAFTYAYVREIGRSRMASLLAALTFSYGGLMASPLAGNGMLSNAVMWLPLLLVAIERVRTKSFIFCLIGGTAAYSMSVLTGIGQGFLYAGILACAYGAFVCLLPSFRDAPPDTDLQTRLRRWQQWRPLAVAVGSILLATGVAAFQILETSRISRRSIRSVLDYETFAQGSFTFSRAWLSLIAPYYHTIDVDAYVPPLSFALAVLAVLIAIRRRARDDARPLFWLAVTLGSFALMLGSNTPFYQLVYRIPLLNRFRVPSRHAFEWTLALSVLSAYGWDALAARIALRRRRRIFTHQRVTNIVAAWVLLLAGTLVGILWRQAVLLPEGVKAPDAVLPESAYLIWKGAFVLLCGLAVGRGMNLSSVRQRACLLLSAIAVTCFFERSAVIGRWWGNLSLPARRYAVIAPTTRYLQQFPPEQNRIYTRVELFSEEFNIPPRLDPTNLSAIYGQHNVAGYEPLVLERYSRALGGISLDGVMPRPGFNPNFSLFTSRSHVLDLLNTTYVVSYTELGTSYRQPMMNEGIIFASSDLSCELEAGATKSFITPSTDADTLALVTNMSNAGELKQGEVVATVRLYSEDGRVIERALRAGEDTAEWAHDRADVLALVQHSRATIYDSKSGDAANTFQAHRYRARIALGERIHINKVEFISATKRAPLTVWKASLYDSVSKTSMPLLFIPSEKWRTEYAQEQVLILHNARALPRAWLVAQAEAVDGEEALRRIRGESTHEFDPRRTALLEVHPQELPAFSGETQTFDEAKNTARISKYEANELEVETSAERASVLVVSEIFYPGWEARLDGERVPIYVTDYLLRGVMVPAGVHHVEMRYTAPAARNGAIISACTLLFLVGLGIYARRAPAERANL